MYRGVGNLCLRALQRRQPGSPPIRFYSSSGGNAGLAAVTAARNLGSEATVVVPESTTQLMKDKIKAAGAEVIQHGESWIEADEYLRTLMAPGDGELEQGVYCPPFDHPDIWDGNGTMIDEILEQLPAGEPPAAIVASVGGGGLFCGLAQGLQRHGLEHVPIIAVETEGAASLNASLQVEENTTIPKISTIATSLGARRVAQRCYDLASGKEGNVVTSVVLSDAQAAQACVKLLDDERIMVEAACGVSVATCYEGTLKRVLKNLNEKSRVVVVVCGGSNITREMLVSYNFVLPSRLGNEFAPCHLLSLLITCRTITARLMESRQPV